MAPEYGATCGFFPVDQETLNYLNLSGRASDRIALVEAYAKAQGLFRTPGMPDPVFTDTLELNLDDVVPSLAGPKRPEGRLGLAVAKTNFLTALESEYGKQGEAAKQFAVEGKDFKLGHGHVVIAAITSCTNTSNPSVLIGAGLLARNAARKGLTAKPWVKTSLAPGSQVVAEYLEKSGLQKDLDALGFYLVGFGCTTCIGNSGPLPREISKSINDNGVIGAAVLSGNRNFEGRVSPDVQANYLASPPLVVAYALAGSLQVDLVNEPLGTGSDGAPVYLKDIWPSNAEIEQFIRDNVTRAMFETKYADVFEGDANWKAVKVADRPDLSLEHVVDLRAEPALFRGHHHDSRRRPATSSARGSSACSATRSRPTTSRRRARSRRHRRPANSCAARQVRQEDFNQYGTRRGNHEVMVRGTFANIRIKNFAVKDEGGSHAGRWLGGASAVRRTDVDLRRGDALPARQRAARGVCRHRIRQRLLARLGGEGHQAARRPRRDRAEL